MLAASWIMRNDSNWVWVSDALLNLGSAILLFGPLLLLTEWLLERRVRTLEADAERTKEDVRQTQRDVGEAQAQISELIDLNTTEGRQEAARQADAVARETMLRDFRKLDELYASLAGAQALGPFAEALRSGVERKLISSAGVRVELPVSELHLRFVVADDDTINLHIEANDGAVLSTVYWHKDRTTAEILAEVSAAAVGLPGFDGIDKFFPGQAPKLLGETLLYAAQYGPQMTGEHEIEKLLEITDAGWIITERGLTPKSRRHYTIVFEGASPIDWDQHILDKRWPESPAFPETFLWAIEMRRRRASET